MTNDSVSEDDIKALTDLCKKNAVRVDCPDAIPLSAKHVPHQGVGDPSVSLQSLKNLIGVNRLPSDQTLKFSASPGITVIYGDNGTGKSSYARVLKSACRSRGSCTPILSDIFSIPRIAQASADIVFKTDGEVRTHHWVDQKDTDPHLTNVFVFDTHAANHYIQANDRTAFIPFGLDILKKLASVADLVSSNLKTERTDIEIKKRDLKAKWSFNANTAVSRFIDELKHSTTEDSINAQSGLTEEKSKRYVELKETLKSDPIKKARETRAQAARIKAVSDALKAVASNLSEEKVAAIKSEIRELKRKQHDLESFKEEFFAKGFISGTGSSKWLELWNAAKSFSENEAYPGSQFPNKDEKCVLCQQDISPDAIGKFDSFKSFIENKLQIEIQKLEGILFNRKADFDKIMKVMPLVTAAKVDIEAEATEELANIESVSAIADDAISVVKGAIKCLREEVQAVACKTVTDRLDQVVDDLENRAKTQESANDPEARKNLISECNELADRWALISLSASVFDYVKYCKEEKLLSDAIKLTRTNAITTKSSELIKSAVTEPFCTRFTEEVFSLGLESIKVEMVEYPGKKGDLTFGIELQNTSTGKPADIASEGEQRCLAIAAFFSELAQANHRSALVFDDPVSSLDIFYREKIAKRLIEEARERQVIVFTHDSFFLSELLVLSENNAIEAMPCYVEWANGRPGAIQDGVPWACQKPEERTKELDAILRQLRLTWNAVPSESNKTDIAKAYSKLRSTLERIVESIIFNGAIERFNPYIDLKRLNFRVDLEEADEAELNRIFKKCCDVTDAHDKPRASQGVTATPADFEQHLKDTKALIETLKGKKRKSGK